MFANEIAPMVEINEGHGIITKRTRFEGSNICTWIGFKHVMYLVEEAVIEYFRHTVISPSKLYEEYGTCFEIVSSQVRILHALHMDDLVQIKVIPFERDYLKCLTYKIELYVERDKKLKAVTGKFQILFKQQEESAKIAPELLNLKDFIVPDSFKGNPSAVLNTNIQDRGIYNPENDFVKQITPEEDNSFIWQWHIPYFYCHYTRHIQHSGYLRLMEEVVDLFLADRGISIHKYLTNKKWIPVVPKANVEILEDAFMEEDIYTVYNVTDIFKDTTYTATMDCYVNRNGKAVHVATGEITHGYAVIENRRDWSLVSFDEETITALKGKR